MAKITPDSVQDLLTAQNIGFSATEMPHGRAFRLEDGAILNVYASGKCVWQGKETASRGRLTELLGEGAVKKAAGATGQTSAATNKVFIVYGHDVEAREQLELLLRRMKLEPVILQNLPIGGQTIIEKLETNLDVRYACVLITPDDEGHPTDQPKEKSRGLGKTWFLSWACSSCAWDESASQFSTRVISNFHPISAASFTSSSIKELMRSKNGWAQSFRKPVSQLTSKTC